MLFDLPLDQLRSYLPPRDEPADFDAFWQQTLDEARKADLNTTFAPVDAGLRMLETFDVTFAGYGGQPALDWLVLPRHRAGPLPRVVEYLGTAAGSRWR